ncbi:MAG: hypothetical protein ACE5DI_06380, partial [Candidatus Micrarchaeia archaeon]
MNLSSENSPHYACGKTVKVSQEQCFNAVKPAFDPIRFGKLFFFALLSLSLLSVSFAAASLQLAEDDGSREGLTTGPSSVLGPGYEYAVKLTPSYPGMLESVDAHVRKKPGSGDDFRWLGGFQDLSHSMTSGPVYGTDAVGTWTWKNADPVDIAVNSAFFAYVQLDNSIYNPNPNTLTDPAQLGTDTTTPNSKSENQTGSGSWVVDSDSNYMIRANINYYPVVSGAVVSPYYASTPPTVSATCTDYDGEDIASAAYNYEGFAQFPMLATDGTYDSSTEAVTQSAAFPGAITDGATTINVSCRDDSGYWSDPQAQVAVFIDRVDPSTTAAYSGTSGWFGWFTSTVSVTLTPSDPAPSSGIYFTSHQEDALGWVNGTAYTLTTEGGVTNSYYSVDNAGNTEPTNVDVVLIDTSAPTAPTLVWPPFGRFDSDGNVLVWADPWW